MEIEVTKSVKQESRGFSHERFNTTQESIFHNNRNIPINAIWDTGSSESVISSRLVKELKLLPNGKSNVASSGKEYASNIYKVTVEIAGKKRFEVHATESEAIEKGDIDMLIGMDIIECGDFAIYHDGEDICFHLDIHLKKLKILKNK